MCFGMFWCVLVFCCLSFGVLAFWYFGVLVFGCVGVLACCFFSVLVCWCFGVLVLWCFVWLVPGDYLLFKHRLNFRKQVSALRLPRAVTRLTFYRAPYMTRGEGEFTLVQLPPRRVIPGEALWGLCWVPTFEFQTVIRAKTAQNLTIYFEN